MALSYNGGKDCLVLLILILACLPAAAAPKQQASPRPPSPSASAAQPLEAIYIAPPDPFPEVEEFVAVSTARYHLALARYALPMRQALEAYQRDRPSVRAIFMGTRRTDPHSEFLTPFSPTDGDWPQFMRVNPVLDWHYAEIWAVRAHFPETGAPPGGHTWLTRRVRSLSGTSTFPFAACTTTASPRSAAPATRGPTRRWRATGTRPPSARPTSWCATTRSGWDGTGRVWLGVGARERGGTGGGEGGRTPG